MEAQYIRPEDYKRMELALGPAKAEAWRVKHGIIIGMPPEEKPMDEAGGLGGGTKVENDDDLNDAMPVGALSYADAQYADAQKQADLANADVTGQISAHLNLLLDAQNKLRKRRVGPSDSEKWLAIAAALGQPTRTGAFGESLGNVAKTLGEQRSARREAEEKRDLMLEKYGLDVGTERLRLLQARATQANQMARAAAAANKTPTMKSVIVENGIAYDPVSGAKLVQPDATAWAALSANPTQANLDNFIRTFGPRFAEQAMRTVGSVTGGKR